MGGWIELVNDVAAGTFRVSLPSHLFRPSAYWACCDCNMGHVRPERTRQWKPERDRTCSAQHSWLGAPLTPSLNFPSANTASCLSRRSVIASFVLTHVFIQARPGPHACNSTHRPGTLHPEKRGRKVLAPRKQARKIRRWIRGWIDEHESLGRKQ